MDARDAGAARDAHGAGGRPVPAAWPARRRPSRPGPGGSAGDPALSRRLFLRGAAGAALALPLLESWPRRALAGPKGPPLRALFVFLPNGVHLPAWRPQAEGPLLALPPTLEPLLPHRKWLNVLGGLTLDGARDHGDGPGDHARAGAAFLTGAHPRKTGGADIQAGLSIDQALARAIGQETPFPSVELGTEPSLQGGACDSGYSCAYSSNVAWSSPSTPLAKEIDPSRAFTRLFLDGEGLTPDERARRDRWRGSVLDLVQDEAKRARTRLAGTDRTKLDEYLEAVRELERRLGKARGGRAEGRAGGPAAPTPTTGIPSDKGEHVRALFDVVRFAFQTDVTRVATVMIGNAGSNRSHREVDVAEGHHDLSHHGGDAARHERLRRVDRFHVEQLAYLLAQLREVDEGGRTLLDNTVIVFGSGIADGDRHDHGDLPILLCGGAGGAIAGGRHLRYPQNTPLCDLYLWLLQRAGARATSFGDSRGPLGRLGR